MKKIYLNILLLTAVLLAQAQTVEIDTTYTTTGKKDFNPQIDVGNGQNFEITGFVSMSDDYSLMQYNSSQFQSFNTNIVRYEKVGPGDNDFEYTVYSGSLSAPSGFVESRSFNKISDGQINSGYVIPTSQGAQYRLILGKFDDSQGTTATRDPSFGNNGVLIFNQPSQTDLIQPIKVLEKSDGSFYLVGEKGFQTNQGNIQRKEIAIIKITAAGSVDTAFGTDGFVYHSVGDSVSRVVDAVIDRNDNLYITGNMNARLPDSESPFPTQARMNYIMKCLPNGDWDTNFGSFSYQTTQYNIVGFDFESPASVSNVVNLDFAPNGDLVVFGLGDDAVPALARIDGNGELVTSFGTNGDGVIKNAQYNNANADLKEGKVTDDGTILILSRMRATSNEDRRPGFIILDENGLVDSTEQASGRLIFGDSFQEDLVTFTLTENNKIIALGFQNQPGGGNSNILTYRLNYKNSNATTSISDINNKQIHLYPNPTSNYVFVDGLTDQSNIALIDLQGKKIGVNRIGNKVELGGLNPGVYFMQIENAGAISVGKIIIEK